MADERVPSEPGYSGSAPSPDGLGHSASIPSAVWVVRWEHNWGTRLTRQYSDYFFAQEPSKEGAINFLAGEGFPARAWSAPVSIFAKPLWRCPAQAIEARSGETRQGLDLKDESAMPEACAK